VYSNRDSVAHGCDTEMEKLLAIGRVFLRARDPVALGRWYQEYLGLPLRPTEYDELPWQQEAGPSGISPFPEGTDYFGERKPSEVAVNRVLASILAGERKKIVLELHPVSKGGLACLFWSLKSLRHPYQRSPELIENERAA